MVKCLFIGNQENDLKIFQVALGETFPGACCYTSENGIEALSVMDEQDIVPDFIFLELEGSGHDAIRFLKKVRRTTVMKGVPVIVHASVPHLDKVEALKKSGAWALHFKPYDHNGICNILNLFIGAEFANVQLN